MKYEVWGYSRSWRRWVRCIYPTQDFADKRYQYLKRIGRAVKPPQPLGTGISPLYHCIAFFDRLLFQWPRKMP
jgi:hypothetical protein